MLLLGLTAGNSATQSINSIDVAYGGLPHAKPDQRLTILHNNHFSIGYSEQRRNPLWVAFKVRAAGRSKLPRRPRFEADPRSSAGVSYVDLVRSGFDRGHMAPNYAMAKLYGRRAQQQSFLMTNITAQRPRLNQLLWQRIEEVEIDHIAPRWGELWVITGPVFDSQRVTLASGVEVADAFFRLWLDVDAQGQPRALALLVPQTVRGDEPLTDFLTTVDHIEQLTGLDFYASLSQQQQTRLEAKPADARAWGLAELACQPARYSDDWQDKNGIHLRYDRCH